MTTGRRVVIALALAASAWLCDALIELGDSDRCIGNAAGGEAVGIVSTVIRRRYNWAETVSGTARERG